MAICSLRLRPVWSLRREVTDAGAESQLDEVVDVFGVWIVADPSGPAEFGIEKLRPDAVERLTNCGELGCSENVRGLQGERVRLAGSHLLLEQLPVEFQRALPVVEVRVERLAKATRPHFRGLLLVRHR